MYTQMHYQINTNNRQMEDHENLNKHTKARNSTKMMKENAALLYLSSLSLPAVFEVNCTKKANASIIIYLQNTYLNLKNFKNSRNKTKQSNIWTLKRLHANISPLLKS